MVKRKKPAPYRKIGGKIYNLDRGYESKGAAVKEAAVYRSYGDNFFATVIKTAGVYGVYTRAEIAKRHK